METDKEFHEFSIEIIVRETGHKRHDTGLGKSGVKNEK
jgi:hypothetical protein